MKALPPPATTARGRHLRDDGSINCLTTWGQKKIRRDLLGLLMQAPPLTLNTWKGKFFTGHTRERRGGGREIPGTLASGGGEGTTTTLGTIAFTCEHSKLHRITHQTHSGNKPNARHHMALQGDRKKKEKIETGLKTERE